MRSNVEVMGHPLHPIVVTVAIGAFVSAFIFDIAAMATGSTSWFEMSFWTLLIGVCAGVLSAVTGLYDYLTLPMSDRARKVATTHLVLNVTFMVLFVVSLVIKYPYAAGGPIYLVPYGTVTATSALDLIAVLLLLTSGWFGGEVVYRHGVAVLEEAAAELRGTLAPGTRVMGTMGGERPPDTEEPDVQS